MWSPRSASISSIRAEGFESPIAWAKFKWSRRTALRPNVSIQGFVFVPVWRAVEEVYQPRGCLLVQGRKNVEVLGCIGYHFVELELGFSLCEPSLWLGSPKGWQLERHRLFFGCHEITFLASGSLV